MFLCELNSVMKLIDHETGQLSLVVGMNKHWNAGTVVLSDNVTTGIPDRRTLWTSDYLTSQGYVAHFGHWPNFDDLV